MTWLGKPLRDLQPAATQPSTIEWLDAAEAHLAAAIEVVTQPDAPRGVIALASTSLRDVAVALSEVTRALGEHPPCTPRAWFDALRVSERHERIVAEANELLAFMGQRHAALTAGARS